MENKNKNSTYIESLSQFYKLTYRPRLSKFKLEKEVKGHQRAECAQKVSLMSPNKDSRECWESEFCCGGLLTWEEQHLCGSS